MSTIQCPSCWEEFPRPAGTTGKCPKCGTAVRLAPARPAAAAAPPAAAGKSVVQCPKCWKDFPRPSGGAGVIKCPQCGTGIRLTVAKAAPPAPAPVAAAPLTEPAPAGAGRRGWFVRTLLALTAVLVIAASGTGFFYWDQVKQELAFLRPRARLADPESAPTPTPEAVEGDALKDPTAVPGEPTPDLTDPSAPLVVPDVPVEPKTEKPAPKSTETPRVPDKFDSTPFERPKPKSVERPAPSGDWRPEPRQDFIARVNAQRQAAGLDRVTIDGHLSETCIANAAALAKGTAPNDLANVKAHSLWTTSEPRSGQRPIASWMAALNDRIRILDPKLRRIGYGYATQEKGGYAVAANFSGQNSELPVSAYPGDRQKDVPLTFELAACGIPGFGPNEGFPVVLSFPAGSAVRKVVATLQDDAKKMLPVVLFTPEKPARPTDQRNLVCLIPRQPLQTKSVYTVSVSADVDAQPWKRTWSFTTVDEAARIARLDAQVEQIVNLHRKNAGLDPVKMDPTLCDGCHKHANYLVVNEKDPSVQGLGSHNEDPKLPGYSEAGARAGKASDIGYNEPLREVDELVATFYHRIPILDPNLERIGVGFSRYPDGRWVSVLDVQQGRGPKKAVPLVLYPGDKQRDVTLSFLGELPDPIPEAPRGKRAGYPITATFPDQPNIKNAKATLTDPAGKEVDVWFSSPEKLANPKFPPRYQWNTICLIPKEPLRHNTTYTVAAEAEVEGTAWKRTWVFTTVNAGEVGPETANDVLAKLNAYRQGAGLEPLQLAPELAQACTRHAQDRAKNLPLAGALRSSVEGFVLYHHDPLVEIDNWMNNFNQRVRLLDPDLRRVNFKLASRSEDYKRGWHAVLALGIVGEQAVFFPAHQQDDVPLTVEARLVPATLRGDAQVVGYPITAALPEHRLLGNPLATVKDDAGKEVECWRGVQKQAEGSQRQVLCLVPKRPLQASTTYTVTASADLDGRLWNATWKFTTGKAQDVPIQ